MNLRTVSLGADHLSVQWERANGWNIIGGIEYGDAFYYAWGYGVTSLGKFPDVQSAIEAIAEQAIAAQRRAVSPVQLPGRF